MPQALTPPTPRPACPVSPASPARPAAPVPPVPPDHPPLQVGLGFWGWLGFWGFGNPVQAAIRRFLSVGFGAGPGGGGDAEHEAGPDVIGGEAC